jgi:hypothetical protein
VIGRLTAGHLFMASDRIGKGWRKAQETFSSKPATQTEQVPFKILSANPEQRSTGAKP